MKSISIKLSMLILVFAQFAAFGQVSEFLGLAKSGGADGIGTLFKTDSVGGNHEVLFDFKIDDEGRLPNSMIEYDLNTMIGTTSSGINGAEKGTIYTFDIKSNTLVEQFRFTENGEAGIFPRGRIVKSSSEAIYGLTTRGGKNLRGGIYRFNPKTKTCKMLHAFAHGDGTDPFAGLLLLSSKFYGVNAYGGDHGLGTLYEFNPKNDSFRVLHHFNKNGSKPLGGLARINNGLLMGSTSDGGKNLSGTLFTYNLITNEYTTVFEFEENLSGSFPIGSLESLSNGLIIGKTQGTVQTLFSYSPTNGAVSTIFTLDKDSFLYGNILSYANSNNGKLLMIVEDRNHGTVLYQFNSSNKTMEPLFKLDHVFDGRNTDFVIKPNANPYLFSNTAGYANAGGIMELDLINKNDKLLVSFGLASNGANPIGGLISHGLDTFYGQTRMGGPNNQGVIFKYVKSNNQLEALQLFNKLVGYEQTSNLFKANNGLIYGATAYYSKNNRGSLFAFNPKTEELNPVMPFTNLGSFTIDINESSTGSLYLLYTGSGNGGLAQYNIQIDSAWQVINFKTNPKKTGNMPVGNLLNLDGHRLFGLTREGGVSGFGVMYEYNTSNDSFTKHHDFSVAAGFRPLGNLIDGKNGKIYFLAQNKSVFLMEFDIVNQTVYSIFEFNSQDGVFPQQIMLANNGKIYGLAKSIEQNGPDLIFEIDLKSKILKRQSWIDSDSMGRIDNNKFIELKYPTSVKNHNPENKSHIEVYPSFTHGSVQIKGLQSGLNHLKIYDVNGSLLHSINLNSTTSNQTQSIDLSALPKGIYLFTIEHDGIVNNQKIVLY